MKALIRKKNEVITENFEVPWIDWKTGAPLTDPNWTGGPYRLVDNYIELKDGFIYDVATYPEPEEEPKIEENEDDYVVIDGKRYSKEELRKLLE